MLDRLPELILLECTFSTHAHTHTHRFYSSTTKKTMMAISCDPLLPHPSAPRDKHHFARRTQSHRNEKDILYSYITLPRHGSAQSEASRRGQAHGSSESQPAEQGLLLLLLFSVCQGEGVCLQALLGSAGYGGAMLRLDHVRCLPTRRLPLQTQPTNCECMCVCLGVCVCACRVCIEYKRA